MWTGVDTGLMVLNITMLAINLATGSYFLAAVSAAAIALGAFYWTLRDGR